MKIGYARCSSLSQNLDAQIEALKGYGCDTIRSEKVSGTSLKGRSELKTILDFIHEGDELVVTRIDRLGRSVLDVSNLVEELTTKGVRLVATEQPVFQDDACGKMMLSLLSVFAEFESNIRKERQMEGIELAKSRGVYRGRQKSIDRDRFKQLHDEGMRKCDISRTMGISRQSVYQLERELTPPLSAS